MPKLTRMQKEVIELKFYNIKVEIYKTLNINWEEDHIIDRLFPAFIKFCRQDPNIILNVLETFEPNKRIIYDNSFLIIKSSIGYPFKEIESINNNFIDNIDKCKQKFIEELVFAKSIDFTEIQKGFNKWKRVHIIPKIKTLKDIYDYLLIEFTTESSITMLKNFDERINKITINIPPITLNK